MSENVILVTGHKSPDTDSFCSALGYANLKTQMGMPAKAICAGKANKETSFVLDYFKVEHPEIVTSFAVRIKDVMEKVPAVDASASLEDILAWRNTHDMNRVPVVKDGKFVGVILPSRLIDALAGAWLDKKTVTAADIVSKAGCQLVSPELKLKEFDRGHAGAFPVVDGDTYFGMVRSKVEAPKEKQKVVLIDHNEKVQIIDDIEDAEIIENIDHHRIGGLTTENPIFIHYEPVGCSCTIVANFYWQYGQEIPKHIAGLLLSAIISDTVLFRSPTCTMLDKVAAEALAGIAEISIPEFASEMFRAGSNLKDKSPEEIFYQDFKKFIMGDVTFGVGQITSLDAGELESIKEQLLPQMESECGKHGIEMVFFMLTNIIEESTELLYYGSGAKEVIEKAFEDLPVNEVSCELKGVVSRKKQLIPAFMMALQNQ